MALFVICRTLLFDVLLILFKSVASYQANRVALVKALKSSHTFVVGLAVGLGVGLAVGLAVGVGVVGLGVGLGVGSGLPSVFRERQTELSVVVVDDRSLTPHL